MPSTPCQVFWPPISWDLKFPGGWKQQFMPRGCTCTTYPSKKALIKMDFENAFNSVRQDKMLCAVEKFIPELLHYVHSAYYTESLLLWGKVEIASLRAYDRETLLALCCSVCRSMILSLVWSQNTKSLMSMMVQLEAHFRHLCRLSIHWTRGEATRPAPQCSEIWTDL